MENTPSRVLIIDTAWLGDVIFTTSLLGTLKDLWPQSEVHVLTAPRGEPILCGHPQIIKLWILDKRGAHRGVFGTLRIASALRQQKFDLILTAHPSFRSRVLSALIGAPVRVGYEGFGARACFTHIVPNDLAVEPDHVQRRLNLLTEYIRRGDSPESPVCSVSDSDFGFRISDFPLSPAPLLVPVQPDSATWAQQFLATHNANTKPLLGLVPGSAWETKRWPLEHYMALAERWIHEHDGIVLAFGGPNETMLLEILRRVDTARILPVINEPIPHVAALLKNCKVVVGNDTGIGLLAVAVQGPRVHLLYGCTQINYAFPSPHSPLHATVPCCLPRTGHGSHLCHWTGTHDPWCLSQLSVDHVWQTIA